MPVECLPMPSLPDAQHGRSCSSQSGHMEARSGRDSFKVAASAQEVRCCRCMLGLQALPRSWAAIKPGLGGD